MSKYLSQRKAALHLGFSPSTFAGYVRAGRGPRHIRVGSGVCRFAIADLDSWLAARTTGGEQ